MLMGDCLALLQDGNFLAQLSWFRVPGGADRLRIHFYLIAFSNWFSGPDPPPPLHPPVLLQVLLDWVTHTKLS